MSKIVVKTNAGATVCGVYSDDQKLVDDKSRVVFVAVDDEQVKNGQTVTAEHGVSFDVNYGLEVIDENEAYFTLGIDDEEDELAEAPAAADEAQQNETK